MALDSFHSTASPVTGQVTTADDPHADISNRAVEHLRRMRYFRKQYDQRRAFFYRQYLSQRDQRMYPDNITPRANSFVPYPFSNVETIVSRVLDAFFSYEDWFECKGRSANDENAAEKMQLVLQTLLKRAKIIPAFDTLVRNLCIYGHAGIKVDWDWDYDWVTYAQPIYDVDPQTGQPRLQPVPDPNTGMITVQPVVLGYQPARKAVPRNRPRFIPIDVYDLLVDPDGGIVAHLTERTLGQMKREQQASLQAAMEDPTKQPLYIPDKFNMLVERVTAGAPKDPDGVVVRLAELWDEYEQTQTIMTFGEDAEAVSWKDLRASFRAAGYSPFKRQVYSGQPLLLYHGEIPFTHKRAPILFTSFIKIPNEIFGLGAIEIVSDLTESLNKFVNMIADNWNLGINRRFAFDINADIDMEALNSFNVPGGKVGVSGDPSKTILPLPFFTPQTGDYQVLELYKQMIEMTSGVSDFYSKAVGSPTGNKTATGITNVMQESNFRFKMFIRNLELDILQPLLEMCASMVQQYVTDPLEVQITGENPQIRKFIQLSPEELIGTLDFDLVAANYASNRMIRQRNLLALMNLAAQSPFLNQYEALKELFKAFEIRNVNKLLYTPEQVQMMQMAQMAQQQQQDALDHERAKDLENNKAANRPKPAGGGGKKKEGRPRGAQQEGKIPGAGPQTMVREMAQGMGANALGLEGMGQVVEG